MIITVTLPDKALAAIEARQDWAGQAEVAVQPAGGPFAPDTLRVAFPGVKRRRVAGGDAKAAAGRAVGQLSPTERLIVEAWNDSEYIRDHAVGEPRNNPVPPRDVPALLPTLRRIVKDPGVGPEQLLTWMGQYFDCCLRRGHVWEDRNHGYSHLGGWLRAVQRYLRDRGRPPYWMGARDDRPIADANGALTLRLADAYAAKFLSRKAFGLRNPSDAYPKFAAAAARLAAFAGANGWGEERAVRTLLDALAEGWGLGGSPPPGALASDNTWDVVVPAYCKARYGG
ncbi:MAG TPA: hypothetical protein VMY35_01260 [Phycisphaerae bacterium]|nr:hypothetical protein [Phycisphaerae bacterium]